MKKFLTKNTTLGQYKWFRRWVGGIWIEYYEGIEQEYIWFYYGNDIRCLRLDPPQNCLEEDRRGFEYN